MDTADSSLDISWELTNRTVLKGVRTHEFSDLGSEVLDLVIAASEELKVVADGFLVEVLSLEVSGEVLAVGELLLDDSGWVGGKLVLKVGSLH